jgi:Uma2 family endonuclease
MPRSRLDWEIEDGTMPESPLHDDISRYLWAVLDGWAARTANGKRAVIARNLAVRWDEKNPRVGLDPDVCVLSPAPPTSEDWTSLRTWVEGHEPPPLAIEIVSHTNPNKDYVKAAPKYAASGTGELWIFDPLLSGSTVAGGPYRLEVWLRNEESIFERVYCGDGPAFSPFLQAWLLPSDDGKRLRISDDQTATKVWLTPEEAANADVAAERTAKEAALAAKETERTAKEAALARVAELEALSKKKG